MTETHWLIIGFVGQGCFFMRFLVQWLASEGQKKSVIPVAFWYFSLAGAGIVLVYAIHRQDPVFIIGQSTGFLIYLRNLHFIYRDRRDKSAGSSADSSESELAEDQRRSNPPRQGSSE